MQVGSTIYDCYMQGIGTLDNIGNQGVVEAIGRDWVIVRDLREDKPIFVDRSPEELEEFLDR